MVIILMMIMIMIIRITLLLFFLPGVRVPPPGPGGRLTGIDMVIEAFYDDVREEIQHSKKQSEDSCPYSRIQVCTARVQLN